MDKCTNKLCRLHLDAWEDGCLTKTPWRKCDAAMLWQELINIYRSGDERLAEAIEEILEGRR